MKTIIKKDENVYLDQESEIEITDAELLEYIKTDTEFKIFDKKDQDITVENITGVLFVPMTGHALKDR